MRPVTAFSLRNPVAVLIMVVLIAVGGVWSAFGLNEELMPDISLPVIAVVTPYPGASPQEVASQVTDPLEKALRGVDGVKDVTSISIANVSEIELELDINANVNDARQKAAELVNQVALPANTSRPTIQEFSFNSQPVVNVTVASNTLSRADLSALVNKQLVPALQAVPGVASVQTAGAQPPTVNINLDPKKLTEHHLSVQQVVQALEADNVSLPLGTASVDGLDKPVQLDATLQSLDDIRQLRIPVPPSSQAGLNAVGGQLAEIGKSVGALAGGMGQLGQGLGVVAAENQLLSHLLTVQGQLFGAELQLSQEQAKPAASQDPAVIARLTATISGLQQAQAMLQKQLNALQSRLPRSSAAVQTPAPATRAPSPPAAAATSTMDTVALGDLGTVTLTTPDSGSLNRTNGQPSVFLGVIKTDNANTVQMARAVNAKLADLSRTLPAGVHIVPLFDASTMVQASVNGMMREAVLGAVFAVFVILLFLRNLRTTLIAVVSIPLSLLIAVLLMKRFDITLNIMSLGGLAVATGRVVDDSIVVIENIYRTWRSGAGSGGDLVRRATQEVGQAITASTITTVAVFLPLGLVSGIVGKIFEPFALTVVSALLSSLLVALTVVPLLALLLVVRSPAAEQASSNGATRPASAWQARYQAALAWALRHKAWVLGLTAVAFVGSVAILPLAGSTFIPASKEKFATISLTMPVGTPRSVTDAKARQIEGVLRSFQSDIQQWNTKVGNDPGQLSPDGTVQGGNVAQMFLELHPDTNVAQFVAGLRSKLQPIEAPGSIQVKELILGGASGSFSVIITGRTSADIALAAEQITRAVQGLPGLANVQNNLVVREPEIRVAPDPNKAAKYGLTASQIASACRAVLADDRIGSVTLDGQDYDMVVHLNTAGGIQSLADLRALPIDTPLGTTVQLGDVAQVLATTAPVSVLHRDGAPYAAVSGTFTTQNTGATTAEALRRIHSLSLPPGVTTELAGDAQQQNQSFSQLIEAIVAGAGLVYIVMLITFGDWRAPFAILFSMPVALIGAFLGTVIGGQPVSVSSLIGILMLMGIVVTNAIVLVDRVEQQRRAGRTVRQALLEAGTTRLRPILMTAIATICALVPLAMGFAEGALISQGLAVVVIGGLVSSTLLTLVIVPVMYELLHRRERKREATAP